MKSIMHSKNDHTCYLCERLNYDNSTRTGLEEHHVFGRCNRGLSTKYGLMVYLCRQHHTDNSLGAAVHFNKDVAAELHRLGQRAFQEHYPELDFQEIFGINYLEEETKKEEKPGFFFLEGV